MFAHDMAARREFFRTVRHAADPPVPPRGMRAGKVGGNAWQDTINSASPQPVPYLDSDDSLCELQPECANIRTRKTLLKLFQFRPETGLSLGESHLDV